MVIIESEILQPLVSVIVPVYNAEKYIENTLISICKQQNVRIEIIVADDCSSDKTAEIVTRFIKANPCVRYLKSEKNFGGPAGPRNLGAAVAIGVWLAFCDADDIWHPLKLAAQLDVASKTDAVLLCSQISNFNDGDPPRLMHFSVRNELNYTKITLFQLLLKNRIATSSVLMKTSLFCRTNGFDASKSLIAVEDYDLWMRILELKNYSVIRLETPLVAYRCVHNSLSASKWRMLRKIIHVQHKFFIRCKLNWLFPISIPLLIASYLLLSIYFRLYKKSM